MQVQVEGHSMFPTFNDGDILCVDTDAYHTHPPQIGDVVVANHPFIRDCCIVKRVHDVTQDNLFVLHGDLPIESTDSRSFGPVPLHLIRGKVVGRESSRDFSKEK